MRRLSRVVERPFNGADRSVGSPAVQPLAGLLVVDLTRHLPGPFASRELLRLGARVVRLEAPDGDPLRDIAPQWDAALNAGKESVVCDLKRDPELGRALCARADVVARGLPAGCRRPSRRRAGRRSRAHRLLLDHRLRRRTGRTSRAPGTTSTTSAGPARSPTRRPRLPPVQVADLGAGSLAAVTEILAALLERERTGRGARLVVSMTHGAHRFVAHRLDGEPVPKLLTGGLACYRIYPTADGRWLTVGALEAKFFASALRAARRPAPRLARSSPTTRSPSRASSRAAIARRPLADWLELFDGEDVSAGPGRDARGGRGGVRRAADDRARSEARRAHRRLARGAVYVSPSAAGSWRRSVSRFGASG